MYFWLIAVLWIIALVFLYRTGIYFFVFLAGSVGLFCLLMYIGSSQFEMYLQYAVTFAMYLTGRLTGLFTAYPQYSMIVIYKGRQAVSFFVDYECSGFIETLVYVSLLAFYPVYRLGQKLGLIAAGVVYIFFSNVARVFLICVIVKAFGISLFFFSHTIFGRIIFFFLMVVLYYVVFTRPHILKQKVGGLEDGNK